MSKVNTFEDAIKLLKTLKGYAEDVDDYEDDFFDDYRQIARVSSRELIDLLLKLEFSDELSQSAESVSADKNNIVSFAEQAAEFVKMNSGVAWEIHKLIDKQHHREDILSKLEERGLDNISDEVVDNIVDAFEKGLSNNEGYYESYWMSADFAIDEIVKEKETKEKVNAPPSLDELVREYEHFIEVTKDIRTVKQAKAFQEKYHIPVEINGVSISEFLEELEIGPTPIEWIRYEFFGHLWYLYDRFDGEPQFDIYYGEYGDYLLAENVTIDNLKENYSNYLLDEIVTLAKNELNGNGSIGYTMPDGLHHIYIYADFLDNEKVFVVEPNRVVDGAHEPFVGDTYIGSWEDFDELCKGIKWCLEQFEDDKKISLEDKLADATSKSQESDIGKTSEIDIEKE